MSNTTATPLTQIDPTELLRTIDPMVTIGTVLATATAMWVWHAGTELRKTPKYLHRSKGYGASVGAFQDRAPYRVKFTPGTVMQSCPTTPPRPPDSTEPRYDVLVFPVAALLEVRTVQDNPTWGME